MWLCGEVLTVSVVIIQVRVSLTPTENNIKRPLLIGLSDAINSRFYVALIFYVFMVQAQF